MKIHTFEVETDLGRRLVRIEVNTDLGRRTIQLAAAIDVDPLGAMPSSFRSLTEVLWDVLQQVALRGPELAATMPKAEA